MPFTVEQFLDVFRRYNIAVWPMQWVLYALAAGAVFIVLMGWARDGRVVSGMLAGIWLWMAVAYHFAFFAAINRAAILFGALFVVEALFLLWVGVRGRQMGFHARVDITGVAAVFLLTYALVLYPMLSHTLGHRYPAAPTFGLPCPTTIFTFGLLLWCEERVPLRVIVIPAAWSTIGFSAARSLGMVEDYGLLVAGALGSGLILLKNRRSVKANPFRSVVASTD